MRKFIASLLLLTSMATPVLAEESISQTQTETKTETQTQNETQTQSEIQTYSFYVVAHSVKSHDYWAVTQDGSKSLWFKESDVVGELLKENDAFKATFDVNGKLLSVQKYNLQ